MTIYAFQAGNNIVTEAGDKIITEAGEYLVTGMDLVWAISATLSGVPTDITADVRL
jgi:hypothetical protein